MSIPLWVLVCVLATGECTWEQYGTYPDLAMCQRVKSIHTHVSHPAYPGRVLRGEACQVERPNTPAMFEGDPFGFR
jgi:hypothetical protein